MRRLLFAFAALSAVACTRETPKRTTSGAESAPAPAADPIELGIGGGEADPHGHISFASPKELVRVSMRVVVDRFAPKGLNFFALQVNFGENHTWAHGGFQTKSSAGGGLVPEQMNWCGLVNRGGGSKDYDEADPAKDLDRIQCASGSEYRWRVGVLYEYVVERGSRVTLPAGTYAPNLHAKAIAIDHPRAMWEWRFVVHPVDDPSDRYEGIVYDSAESISGFLVWNESGYGSKLGEQHVTWSHPRFRTLSAPDVDQTPTKWTRD